MLPTALERGSTAPARSGHSPERGGNAPGRGSSAPDLGNCAHALERGSSAPARGSKVADAGVTCFLCIFWLADVTEVAMLPIDATVHHALERSKSARERRLQRSQIKSQSSCTSKQACSAPERGARPPVLPNEGPIRTSEAAKLPALLWRPPVASVTAQLSARICSVPIARMCLS